MTDEELAAMIRDGQVLLDSLARGRAISLLLTLIALVRLRLGLQLPASH